MSASRLLTVWVPVVLWAGFIFALSSIPSLSTDLGTADLVLRKLAHLAEYAVLGFLLLRALDRELPSVAAGVAYAGSDEIHQLFVAGREASPYDVLVDAAGVLIGVYVVRRVLRRARPSGSWGAAGTLRALGARTRGQYIGGTAEHRAPLAVEVDAARGGRAPSTAGNPVEADAHRRHEGA